MTAEPARRPGSVRGPLVLVAVLILAVNLRPAVNALGAVMPELQADTGLSGGLGGLLLALPTLSFAVLGIGAPAIAARIGSHRTVLIAILLLGGGQLVRSLLPGIGMLFLGSVLTLAGIAVGNVLLPGLVRLHFPGAVTTVTACYTALLTAGGAIGSAVTIPIEDAMGGTWRLGIGMWALLAGLALIPWVLTVAAVGPPRLQPRPQAPIAVASLRRSRLAWAMVGYFGLQSLQAYVMFGWLPTILVDAGMDESAAAFQVFVLASVGIPIAAVVPWLLGRITSPRNLIVAMILCYLGGYLGLAIAPTSATYLWSVLLGIGGGSFPTALTLIALRARTPAGTMALSAFTQSVGYLLASAGPIVFGLVRDLTGGWTWSLVMLMLVLVAHLAVGVSVSRRRYVEDELPGLAASAPPPDPQEPEQVPR